MRSIAVRHHQDSRIPRSRPTLNPTLATNTQPCPVARLERFGKSPFLPGHRHLERQKTISARHASSPARQMRFPANHELPTASMRVLDRLRPARFIPARKHVRLARVSTTMPRPSCPHSANDTTAHWPLQQQSTRLRPFLWSSANCTSD